MRDVVWASWHSALGWAVQGASERDALLGGVSSSLAVSRSQAFLAACEDAGAGEIRVVRFPALPGAQARRYPGHASPPVALRFLSEDSRLVSAGSDGCLIVWRMDGLQPSTQVSRASVDGDLLPRHPASRPVRGHVLRLGIMSDVQWVTSTERANLEKYLVEEIAEILELEKASAHARMLVGIYSISGKNWADMHVMPAAGGVSATVITEKLERLANDDLSVLRGKIKMLNGEVCRLRDVEDEDEDVMMDEFDGVAPWLGAAAPPTDWDPLTGSVALTYPPTEKMQQVLVDIDGAGVADDLDVSVDQDNDDITQPRKRMRTTAVPLKPEKNLELEFVHGYNGAHCRDNARYIHQRHSDGRHAHDHARTVIAYCAGALGIVLNVDTQRQTLLKGHTEEVTCIALNREGDMIATGEGGRSGTIRIFDLAHDTEQICKLGWVHPLGVLTLFFLGDDFCVSVGADPNHVVAVWDWNSSELVCSQQGCALAGIQSIHAACTTGDASFVTVGEAHIMFWNIVGGSRLVGKAGIWGLKARPQTLLCATGLSHDDEGPCTVLTGTMSGTLLVWRGRQLVQSLEGPKDAALTCVCELPLETSASNAARGIRWVATGHSDGSVSVWEVVREDTKERLRMAHVFNVPALAGVKLSCVRSLDGRPTGEGWVRILVGLACCSLAEIEVDLRDERLIKDLPAARRVIVAGHGLDVVGLCSHPEAPLCATVGMDGEMRVWNVLSRTLAWKISIGEPAYSVDWRVGGEHIAVGLVSGGMVILSASALRAGQDVVAATVARRGEKRGDAWEVKYSPDGRMLAVGGGGKVVDVYQADADYNRKGTCKGHLEAIVHLDWSASSRVLRSGDECRESLLWDVEAASKGSIPQLKNASKYVNELWGTYHCPLTWATQGLQNVVPSMTKALSVDRSNDASLLALGDFYGNVSLHTFPCLHASIPPPDTAHSSRAQRVRFTFDDTCVLSVGGPDMCVLQWRNPRVPSSQHADVLALTQTPFVHAKSRNTIVTDEGDDEDEDGILSLRPFEAAIHAPTGWNGGSSELKSLPDKELELEHVFGYTGHASRANAWLSESGRIVYPAAKVCVTQETDKCGFQRLMCAHDGEVTCLVGHPNRRVFASGQRGEPLICVWDDSQLDDSRKQARIVTMLRGESAGSVTALAFSRVGRYLAGVGGDVAGQGPAGGGQRKSNPSGDGNRDATAAATAGFWLCVWDWKTGTKIASASAHSMPVLAIAWHPETTALVTCGVRHVKFWTLEGVDAHLGNQNVEHDHDETAAPEGLLVSHKGRFAGRSTCTTTLCVDFVRTKIVTMHKIQARTLDEKVHGRDGNDDDNDEEEDDDVLEEKKRAREDDEGVRNDKWEKRVSEEWRTLIGTQEGDVQVWCEHVLLYVVHAHTGPVVDMCALKDETGGYVLATGGADGVIGLFKMVPATETDDEKEELRRYPEEVSLAKATRLLSSVAPGLSVGVRSVRLERSSHKVGDVACYSILIGTALNEIMLVRVHVYVCRLCVLCVCVFVYGIMPAKWHATPCRLASL
jgi:WD40 repeat protein